jgi:hypothetical protein
MENLGTLTGLSWVGPVKLDIPTAFFEKITQEFLLGRN